MSTAFVLTDEQQMLRDSVHRWTQSVDVRQSQPFHETWQHFADMGWLAAGLPEAFGGLGGTIMDFAIIAEGLGAGLVRLPYVDVIATAARILLAVDPESLGGLANGESIILVAHDEQGTRGDPAAVQSRAAPAGAHWQLTGTKTAVLGATHAHRILCTAQVADASLTLFEIDEPAAALRAFVTVDDREGADLVLDRAPARLVGPVGGALGLIEDALNHTLVLESAEAVGAMQRAFDLTRDYLLARRQYGQRIADFQALRHLLADMFIELEQARSIVMRAVDALQTADLRTQTRLAAATKARVAAAGLHVTGQAIQLHGGIGVTQEYPVGHYFNRLVAFNQRHGNADAHIVRFAELQDR